VLGVRCRRRLVVAFGVVVDSLSSLGWSTIHFARGRKGSCLRLSMMLVRLVPSLSLSLPHNDPRFSLSVIAKTVLACQNSNLRLADADAAAEL
jgi:hypothetical protein